jgi:hypothetical protein
MPMDREHAVRIVEILMKASALCNNSIRVVKANDSLGQVKVFGRLAGAFLGNAYTNVLAPIWQAFPELKPIDEPYVQSEPALSPASREAISAFLVQAKAGLRLVEDSVARDEHPNMFPFGGLPEVESTVTEIEQFLAMPRHRDSDAGET